MYSFFKICNLFAMLMLMLRPMPTPMSMLMLRYQSRNFQTAIENYIPCFKNQFIHANLRKLFLITAFSGQVQPHKIDCSIILMGVLSYSLYRRRHHRCSVKKVFLKISQVSQENTCVGVSFNKFCNLIKKRLQHRCFTVKSEKFLKNICELLFLHILISSKSMVCTKITAQLLILNVAPFFVWILVSFYRNFEYSSPTFYAPSH